MDLPLTLKFTPLGAFVFTSRLTASSQLSDSSIEGLLAHTSCGVVEILSQELRSNLLADDASIYCLRERHTSFEAFAISENAGTAIVMDVLCNRCSRRFGGRCRICSGV